MQGLFSLKYAGVTKDTILFFKPRKKAEEGKKVYGIKPILETNEVEYKGKRYSLSSLAKMLYEDVEKKSKVAYRGPDFFYYTKGKEEHNLVEWKIIHDETRIVSHVQVLKEQRGITDNECDRNIWDGYFGKSRNDEIMENTDKSVCSKLSNREPLYEKKDFLEEVFISTEEYDVLKNLLLYKKNIILQGAPGVGKTFMAKRLAYSVYGGKEDDYIEYVQFHQSYSYEDFIMGYKPTKGGFELKTGVFYNFCKKAQENLEHPYFFIIDEINRGNLSRIFGESLMLIEKDKRGAENAVKLAYNDEMFFVPENVYIIGMMNTADRSLAIMDYALRRRFSFYTVEPAFSSDGFFKRLLKNGISECVVREISGKFDALNDYIADEKVSNLGKGFCIGHSYFCSKPNEGQSQLNWFNCILTFEITPLLREYWWDEKQKADDWIDKLKINYR